ncbi:hypothetical protein JYA63_10505 [Fictibacillus nanhaiensis]|uniref:Uncharacterized protein n=1 Tax=Fictibacillus nanhaiensis TaxID=742169 RepID=A0ABS2ZRQ0_9BACL|nr:hypothetical protein [Fictibacillus nanhaiensis]
MKLNSLFINKSVLFVLIIVTGLYCVADILFDLSFNSFIDRTTNIIEALFFLFLLIYVTVDSKK